MSWHAYIPILVLASVDLVSAQDSNCINGFITTMEPGYCFSSACGYVGGPGCGSRSSGNCCCTSCKSPRSCDEYSSPCKMSACPDGQARVLQNPSAKWNKNAGPSVCPSPLPPTNAPTTTASNTVYYHRNCSEVNVTIPYVSLRHFMKFSCTRVYICRSQIL